MNALLRLTLTLTALLLGACSPTTTTLPTVVPTAEDVPLLLFWQAERGTLETLDAVDYWQFLGAAGDTIALRAVNRGVAATMTLLRNGEVLAEGQAIEFTLSEGGRYDVQVRPAEQEVGDYEIGLGYADRQPPQTPQQEVRQVVGVPTPTPGFTTIGEFIQQVSPGDDVGSALTSSSPEHVYTFALPIGTYVTLDLARVSGTLDPFLTLYDPDGNIVAMDDNSGDDRNARLRNIRLNDDGLYSVQVWGASLYGDYRLRISEGFQRLAPDAQPTQAPTQAAIFLTPTFGPVTSDTRLVDHAQVIGSLPRSGDFQRFSFQVSAGQTFRVWAAPYQDSTISPQLEVFGPLGEQRALVMASTSNAQGAALTDTIEATESGVYSIIVTGEGDTLGAFVLSAGLGLTARDNFQGTAAASTAYDGNITLSGERHTWLLPVQPDDVVTVAVSSASATFDPLVQITTVGGVLIAQDDNSGNGGEALIRLANIISPALYTIRVMDAQGRGTGDYTLLWRYVNAAPTTTPEPPTSNILAVRGNVLPNRYQFYVFQGQAGQTVQLQAEAVDDSPLDPVLALLDPQGEVIAEADDSDGTLNPRMTVTLPEDGSYTARVNGYLSSGRFDLNVAIVFGN